MNFQMMAAQQTVLKSENIHINEFWLVAKNEIWF